MDSLSSKSLFGVITTLGFLAASCITVSEGQQNGTCTRHLQFTPVQNFSMERILGDWIAFRTYAAHPEDAGDPGAEYMCLEARINHFDGIMPYRRTQRFRRVLEEVTTLTIVGPDYDNNEAVWTRIGAYFMVEVAHEVFVQTDYDNWAIQYSCYDDELTTSKAEGQLFEKMTIWTRTREPDMQMISLLEVLVQNYGFSLENEIVIDQVFCPWADTPWDK